MADVRHRYYQKNGIVSFSAIALGVFLFAGSVSANMDDEREANRARFQDAIEERRDVFKDRVRGIASDHAGSEAKVSTAGDDGFFKRVWDRIAKSRDEFNQRISERRDIFVKKADGELAEYPEGIFPWMAEKFKIAFLRVAR